MERPDWSAEKSFLSLRDIGRLGYQAMKDMIARRDEKYAGAVNGDDDE